jgi:predicted HicB family RNase H-like nuclease
VLRVKDEKGQVIDDLRVLFVRVPAEVHEVLRQQAALNSQPLAELVRSVVARYVEEAVA